MFAQVVVLVQVGRSTGKEALFDYIVPDDLRQKISVGSLVTVPFGSRQLYGVVMALTHQTDVTRLRPIEAIVDPVPVLNPAQVALAHWMSQSYLAPLFACVDTMLPPGIYGYADTEFALVENTADPGALSGLRHALVDLLDRRGPMGARQIERALAGRTWRPVAHKLVREGVLAQTHVLAPPHARAKTVRTAQLAPNRDVEADLAGLRSAKYRTIIDFLRQEAQPIDVSWVYAETGCARYHLDKLAERGLIAFDREEVWRDPLEGQVFKTTSPPALTSDQESVWESIRSTLRSTRPGRFLLHGVTGSGKTEVYLRAVGEVLSQNRRALVLVPEISLTPQTTSRFAARYPGQVAVLHSGLTQGERYDTWRRARGGEIDIIIGPRSALFSPLDRLGLIVLDEEHDGSYKQQAPVPYYHTRETALKLAEHTGATVILGSATPSLESTMLARQGRITRLEMPRRIMGHTQRIRDLQARFNVPETKFAAIENGPPDARFCPLPPVSIVDLRAELRAGNRSIFSRDLQSAIDDALSASQQVILFLNRRGSATFVLCRDCGHVMTCPRCDVPLTQHNARGRLVCHHCNYQEPPPTRCPECSSSRIRYFGLGTERVEDAVAERWPDACILRWDRDTARSHAGHTAILDRFVEGTADVLVGTQMIAKGLDLPFVTVVGVISADTMLNLPDFRAAERTFQLLAQVAGRAGRGLLGGRVVIQSYHPENYAIVAAANHDYSAFSERELAFRRQHGYPPFRRLAKLLFEHKDAHRAQDEAETLAASLREIMGRWGRPESDLIGPAPAFFARVRERYRWQILLRHDNPAGFLRNVPIPRGWRVDIDPISTL